MSEKQGIVLTKKKAIALAAIALLLVIGGVIGSLTSYQINDIQYKA